MARIEIVNDGTVRECAEGANLLAELLRASAFVDNPCNGTGVCGKCKVRIVDGEVSKVSATEQKLLSREELAQGIRLACMTCVSGDIQVELLQKERKHKVLTEGYVPEFARDEHDEGYGVAIDIGTTTVVTSLVELASGREITSASMINVQKHFGLDVLTRITYEYEHAEEGIEQLRCAIVDSVNDMLVQVCRDEGISTEEILEIDIAANCTMMHMLLGTDARSIGRSPYQPAFLGAQKRSAGEIGLRAGMDNSALVYCLPQVSAFIGADIVAGAYVCELEKQNGNVLFIDIGTNGEIVLSQKGRLLCCSCAAGPALEGMNISCGMRAAEGAIEDVKITEHGVEFTCIDGKEPVGICGSGILAVLKELIRTGLVRKNGAFVKKENIPEEDYRYPMLELDGRKRKFKMTERLRITQGDVRQVQLAKGAILSGFYALLKKAGRTMEDLDQVMIAGQFGAHLPAESLIGTGILPKEVKDKLIYVGNSSKTGAYLALMSGKAKQEMEELAHHMEYMELGATEGYERLFADCLMFPDESEITE